MPEAADSLVAGGARERLNRCFDMSESSLGVSRMCYVRKRAPGARKKHGEAE
jgi:hypothetical protein